MRYKQIYFRLLVLLIIEGMLVYLFDSLTIFQNILSERHQHNLVLGCYIVLIIITNHILLKRLYKHFR